MVVNTRRWLLTLSPDRTGFRWLPLVHRYSAATCGALAVRWLGRKLVVHRVND